MQTFVCIIVFSSYGHLCDISGIATTLPHPTSQLTIPKIKSYLVITEAHTLSYGRAGLEASCGSELETQGLNSYTMWFHHSLWLGEQKEVTILL